MNAEHQYVRKILSSRNTWQLCRRLSFSLTVFLAPVAYADQEPSERVTVEAKWDNTYGSLHPCTMRQLAAWRKGQVRFSQVGYIRLQIRRVVEGHLQSPDFPKTPEGVWLRKVIPLDAAAAGVDAHKFDYDMVYGFWKLTLLPDGSYAVFNLEDTSLADAKSAAEIRSAARMTADLASDDTQVKCNALELFGQRRCPALFPKVFEMLESEAPVADGRWLRSGRSTLGRVAAAVLLRATDRFGGSGKPSERDPSASWKAWWERILKTEPFPAMVPDTVDRKSVV